MRAPLRPVPARSTPRIAEPDLPEHSVHEAASAFRKWTYPRPPAAMPHGSVDVSTRWRIYTPTKSSGTIQPSDAKIGSISSSVRAGANSNAWRTYGPMRWGCLSAASIS